MDYAIQVKNLCKNYKSFKLDNVSFDVPSGCIMGLIGENGAGKTTIIKLILNQLQRDGGSVTVLGLDNIDDEKAVKEQLGVVFDESYFYETITPLQVNKIMKNIYKNWDISLYNKYITSFKLPENKPVKEFSRGMKMKLCIATALAHKPKLLILDEATSGLDPIIRNEILDIFLDFIQDEQHSVLISSHITSDLEKVADYITFIHEGKVLLSECKDTLLSEYGILKCGVYDFASIDKSDIIGSRKSDFGYEMLVKDKSAAKLKYRDFTIDTPSLEDIMLYYVRSEAK